MPGEKLHLPRQGVHQAWELVAGLGLVQGILAIDTLDTLGTGGLELPWVNWVALGLL